MKKTFAFVSPGKVTDFEKCRRLVRSSVMAVFGVSASDIEIRTSSGVAHQKEPYARNCRFCLFCGEDDDGSDYPTRSWPVCEKKGREFVSNLKSFPFKKEQPCHEPDFWRIEDPEVDDLFSRDDWENKPMEEWESFKVFKRKYGKPDEA
jgi:hypothetical protein